MENTIGSAVKTLSQIEGLVERMRTAKDGSEISKQDIILTLNILDQVRESILRAPAYSPIDLDDNV